MVTSFEEKLNSLPNSQLNITVLILAKNEEKAIAGCIQSVQDFKQVIVVDSASNDKTVEISKSLGAEVVNFNWNRQYPKKKQWALELKQIRFDWVLFLDSDERISDSLRREIFRFMDKPATEITAIELPLRYHFSGKPLHSGLKIFKRALIDRRYCKFPEIDDLSVTNMWEVEGHYQPILSQGKVAKFRNYLDHADPDSLFQYFDRHNRYSDWEAYLSTNKAAMEQVRLARTSQGKLFSSVPFKPLLIFFYSYFCKLGFLDGRAGFDFAISRSFYYWQIRLKSRQNLQALTSGEGSGHS